MRIILTIAWMVCQAITSRSGEAYWAWMPDASSEMAPLQASPPQQKPEPANPNFSLKVNVTLVMVDATVYDKRGALVGNLRPEDFGVYDNGIAQDVTHFSQDELPLAIALVIDRSPSIAPYLTELYRAARTALQRLRPEDEVALFCFDSVGERLTGLTRDLNRIARVISLIPIGSGTNINDVLYDAARYLHAQAPDRRRAIILVSDNYPSVQGGHRESDTLRELLEAGATLYSLKTPGQNPSGSVLGGPKVIDRFARETGGEVLGADQGKLSSALDTAITNLRRAYVLGFTPASGGDGESQHRLLVKIKDQSRCPDCRVQARTGYYAGAHRPEAQPSGAIETSRLDAMLESFAAMTIRAAANNNAEAKDIPFTVNTTLFTDIAEQKTIKVNLQIDINSVEFTTVEGRHKGQLLVAVYFAGIKGKAGSEWKRIEMRLKDDYYQQLQTSGLPFSTEIPIQDEKQTLKIIVYDSASGKMGKKLVRLNQ